MRSCGISVLRAPAGRSRSVGDVPMSVRSVRFLLPVFPFLARGPMRQSGPCVRGGHASERSMRQRGPFVRGVHASERPMRRMLTRGGVPTPGILRLPAPEAPGDIQIEGRGSVGKGGSGRCHRGEDVPQGRGRPAKARASRTGESVPGGRGALHWDRNFPFEPAGRRENGLSPLPGGLSNGLTRRCTESFHAGSSSRDPGRLGFR